MKKVTSIILAAFLFSCSNDDSPEEILSQMNSIDMEIQQMISTSCSETSQCMATPYGAKACGGPATYLVHSSNIDLARFNQLVNLYTQLNELYNKETGILSDCAIEIKPDVSCLDGNCQEIRANN